MKHSTLILIFISILIVSKLLIIGLNYDNIKDSNTYDFEYYQQVSKKIIGQDIEITKRSWQYPPLYSIIIIPTLFIDTTDYLLFIEIIFAIISFYFLFLLLKAFNFTTIFNSMLISVLVIGFDSSFVLSRLGMPVCLVTTLFIVVSYYLYTIKKITSFYMCSISFTLLILTKYLFIALIPFIIYWLMYTYKHESIKKVFIFFIPSLILLCIWLTTNMFNYGFTVVGAIGGYSHIDINLYLVPSKIVFLFTNIESMSIIFLYICFMISYILLFYSKVNHNYIQFNILIILYFICTFFLFDFLYEVDGFRLRYFLYQTPIIFVLSFINIILFTKTQKTIYTSNDI